MTIPIALVSTLTAIAIIEIRYARTSALVISGVAHAFRVGAMAVASAYGVAVAAVASRSGYGVDAFAEANHTGAIAPPGLSRKGMPESSVATQDDEGEGEDGECESIALHDFCKDNDRC